MLVALCRKITSLSHSIAGLRDIICKRPKCFQVISTPQDKDDCYGMISSDISSTKICFLMSNHSNLKTDEIVRMIFWTNIWALCDFLQTRCLLLFMKSFSIINKVCLIQGQDKTTQYYLTLFFKLKRDVIIILNRIRLQTPTKKTKKTVFQSIQLLYFYNINKIRNEIGC